MSPKTEGRGLSMIKYSSFVNLCIVLWVPFLSAIYLCFRKLYAFASAKYGLLDRLSLVSLLTIAEFLGSERLGRLERRLWAILRVVLVGYIDFIFIFCIVISSRGLTLTGFSSTLDSGVPCGSLFKTIS